MRDHQGRVALSVGRTTTASTGIEAAEAETVKLGLIELAKVSRGHIIVEFDCLSLINRLKGKEPDRSHLLHIINDIKIQAGLFSPVSWPATRR